MAASCCLLFTRRARGRLLHRFFRMVHQLKKLARYAGSHSWSMTYTYEKIVTQMPAVAALADVAKLPFVEAVTKAGEHLESSSLCSQMVFGGEAMAPFISCRPRFGAAASDPTSKPSYNMLLVRELLYPEVVWPDLYHVPRQGRVAPRHPLSWPSRRAHVGDVVAFTHPNPVDLSVPGGLLVRRVVALEGDVMERVGGDRSEDDDGGEEVNDEFVIPAGHAWVLADNEDVPVADATDSRTFGPLPLSHVVGRVVYAVRSSGDHGVVQNSNAAAQVDQPVLAHELDVQQMAEELEEFVSGVAEKKTGHKGVKVANEEES